jgi:hypothetical protein
MFYEAFPVVLLEYMKGKEQAFFEGVEPTMEFGK